MAVRVSGPVAPLVVEAPHPFFEFETGVEARRIFERAQGRALLMAGTHRCANAAYSSCDGTTGVCSKESERYRESDMAHVTESMFQVMHREVTELYSETVAVSLHGFSDDGLSLSNGTTEAATQTAPVARLGEALAEEFPQKRVTYCNDIPGRTREERLCGTTNVQGRHLNGAARACGSFAASASGRFVHLEQSLSVRQASSRVATAFARWTDSAE
jgi:hypothetical protein